MGQVVFTFQFPPTLAKFVKITNKYDDASPVNLQLAEVVVYSCLSCGINVALQGIATQSSDHYEGGVAAVASRAIDGNTDGRYTEINVAVTTLEPQPWWQVELNTVSQVRTVVVYNRQDCCWDRLSRFKVELLDAGSNVIGGVTQDYTGTAVENQVFTFHFPPTLAKFVKITNNYDDASPVNLQLAEVEVYQYYR